MKTGRVHLVVERDPALVAAEVAKRRQPIKRFRKTVYTL
jgi:hypothetical protein